MAVAVAVAGYSVGELAACSAAGMFGVADALALAVRRAHAMDDSAAGLASGVRQPQVRKQALSRQIASTVQWHRSMETVAERMPRCVLAAGPGTTLSRMWAARHPGIAVRSADEFHSAEAVIAWVRKRLD